MAASRARGSTTVTAAVPAPASGPGRAQVGDDFPRKHDDERDQQQVEEHEREQARQPARRLIPQPHGCCAHRARDLDAVPCGHGRRGPEEGDDVQRRLQADILHPRPRDQVGPGVGGPGEAKGPDCEEVAQEVLDCGMAAGLAPYVEEYIAVVEEVHGCPPLHRELRDDAVAEKGAQPGRPAVQAELERHRSLEAFGERGEQARAVDAGDLRVHLDRARRVGGRRQLDLFGPRSRAREEAGKQGREQPHYDSSSNFFSNSSARASTACFSSSPSAMIEISDS